MKLTKQEWAAMNNNDFAKVMIDTYGSNSIKVLRRVIKAIMKKDYSNFPVNDFTKGILKLNDSMVIEDLRKVENIIKQGILKQ